jgi:hypothetical protein
MADMWYAAVPRVFPEPRVWPGGVVAVGEGSASQTPKKDPDDPYTRLYFGR